VVRRAWRSRDFLYAVRLCERGYLRIEERELEAGELN
jgi:hypothetical protein